MRLSLSVGLLLLPADGACEHWLVTAWCHVPSERGLATGGVPVLREEWGAVFLLRLPSPVLPSWQREVDRNQELQTRIRQLQEREAEVEEEVKEQQERNRSCRQSLDAAGRKLREKEACLATAGEVRAAPGHVPPPPAIPPP